MQHGYRLPDTRGVLWPPVPRALVGAGVLGGCTLRWLRLGCGVHGLRGCRVQGTGLVRLGRQALPPGYSPGYRVQVQGYRLVGVSVGPAVFSCFCEAVTRCFAKPFRLYARLSDFRQAVGVIALPRWFNASDGLVTVVVGAPHGVYPRPGFQTAR